MKKLFIILLLLPAYALASVSGIDDLNANISGEVQQKLDDAIMTYYQHPTVQKVETVLDTMNDSRLLRKKTAWAPMIGFLTIVFANNKQHIFAWMGRNDYNTYAQDVFIAALLHAKLHEAALVFAQAHQWSKYQVERLRAIDDGVDLKHLAITVPGHIDTLWGAFFASGDPVYVNEIIDALATGTTLQLSDSGNQPIQDVKGLAESKKLIQSTLWQYAQVHKPVRDALKARIASEKNASTREMLERFLVKPPSTESQNHPAKDHPAE
jgi:hypothetical protein